RRPLLILPQQLAQPLPQALAGGARDRHAPPCQLEDVSGLPTALVEVVLRGGQGFGDGRPPPPFGQLPAERQQGGGRVQVPRRAPAPPPPPPAARPPPPKSRAAPPPSRSRARPPPPPSAGGPGWAGPAARAPRTASGAEPVADPSASARAPRVAPGRAASPPP